MTRSEAVAAIGNMIDQCKEQVDPFALADEILNFIDRERMSTHQADEWEPEERSDDAD